jgi:methylglutaconyl-CoA hydratase
MNALRVERDGGILRVTLARPKRRNAFDAALIGELAEAFADVGDARVVVLAGDGPSFCAGADVEWQRSSIELTYDENVEDYRRLYRMLQSVHHCPAPVVVVVQGFALGGGSGLVACADVAVAAEDATFGFSEVRLGIIPAVISPMVLAKIGPAATRRFFVTGERFDAGTALRIGLVDEVAGDLDAAVGRLVDAILAGGPAAVREAKRLVLEPGGEDDLLARASERRTSPEGQDGLRAFLEKREPGWASGSSS